MAMYSLSPRHSKTNEMKTLALLSSTLEKQNTKDLVWAIFRLYCGISIAIGAGWAKVPTPDWFVEQVGEIGFTFISAEFWAHLAAYGEFIGGLLIAFGIFTRIAAFQLAFQFFVVSFIWYSEPELFGMYYQQLIFWSFILITFMGGGKYSLDTLIKKGFKPSAKSTVIAASFIGLLPFQVKASKPVKGNGNIITEIRTIGEINSVDLGTYCQLEIRCGEMSRIELKGDENILEVLDTKKMGKSLKIDTKEWLQPTFLKVVVYLPYLKSYSHEGWSHTDVVNIDSEKLHIDLPTGSIKLQGMVNELNLNLKGGNVEAAELIAQKADVQLDGRGKANLQVIEFLKVDRKAGTLTYTGDPQLEITGENKRIGKPESIVESQPLRYLEFKVKNNSSRKQDYIIVGPDDNPFSYGFPVRAWGSRTERGPVGTKIYYENALGMRGKLLLEVTEDTEGKTVVLTD